MPIRRARPLLTLLLAAAAGLAAEAPPSAGTVRILSWNVSDDAFVAEKREFASLLRLADPDIVLLDEVAPSASEQDLMDSLRTLRSGELESWTVTIGASGGRQRTVIASRAPQESLAEFSGVVPYPAAERRYLEERLSAEDLAYSNYSMAGGIPVGGAIILDGDRRLLTIIADLQCCGDDQDSWQEYRRRVEAREIRRLLRQVLQRSSVDGIVVAGDFNLVNGPMPLVLLSGPYTPGSRALLAAELYHGDRSAAWTWDGRGTSFPSATLDFQLFDPQGLTMRSGFILDTQGLPPDTLAEYGLEIGASQRTGRHRPLLVEYRWR